jgi:hypothetical protein
MKTEIEVALRGGKLSASEAREILASNLEDIGKLETLTSALLRLARSEQQPAASPQPALHNPMVIYGLKLHMGAKGLEVRTVEPGSVAEAHPFPAEATWKFSQHNPFNAVYETNKRSAYLMVQRQRRHPFLSLFDGADPNATTAARQTTTVPTQALYFINDPFFHAQADTLAKKLASLPDDDTRITASWRILFQRQPTAAETQRTKAFLATYPADIANQWAAQVRVLVASNEFLHID